MVRVNRGRALRADVDLPELARHAAHFGNQRLVAFKRIATQVVKTDQREQTAFLATRYREPPLNLDQIRNRDDIRTRFAPFSREPWRNRFDFDVLQRARLVLVFRVNFSRKVRRDRVAEPPVSMGQFQPDLCLNQFCYVGFQNATATQRDRFDVRAGFRRDLV
jgi:hypothetical protein